MTSRTNSTDSPLHATTRHAAPSPTPARSWLGLTGGPRGLASARREAPLSRPHATAAVCARLTGVMRLFCFHPHPHPPQSHTPKIDSGVIDVMDSPPLAMTWHTASSPAPARSWLGLAGGGEGGPKPPPPCSASRYRGSAR